LPDIVQKLETAWKAFCELRDILRMTDQELSREDSNYKDKNYIQLLQQLCEIESQTKIYQQNLQNQFGYQLESKHSLKAPEAIILKYIKNYNENLFGQPVLFPENNSTSIVFERTNCLMEHFFSKEKHLLRRRLGKANLGRDLEDQPAQVFLVSNLRNPDYVRILCGSLKNLPGIFADLDKHKLVNNQPLRDNMKSRLKNRVKNLLTKNVTSEIIQYKNLKTCLSTTPTTVV
jgi:hypothetical protein